MGSFRGHLLPLQEAVTRLDEALVALPALAVEHVSMHRAVGRVLAQDLCADRDLPPFHRVAMDGFAVRSADLAGIAALTSEPGVPLIVDVLLFVA